MKFVLLLWVTLLAGCPAFAQIVLSNVYSFSHSPAHQPTGREEHTLAEGTTRDYSHFIIQTITLATRQPAQPVQQLDEEAVLFVTAGELTLTLGAKQKTLVPGSIIMVMPGDDFRVENKASQPLSYYQVRYTSNEMPDLDLYRLMGSSFWVDWQEVAPTTSQQGTNRKLSTYPTIMSDRIVLESTTLTTTKSGHPAHTHRAAELLLILHYPVQAQIDGEQKLAQPGDLIFIESEIMHGLEPVRPEGSSYVSVQL